MKLAILAITLHYVLTFSIQSEAFKILIFSPTNSRSHMIFSGRIADTLAKAGHDVTLLEVEILVEAGSAYKPRFAKLRPVRGFDKGYSYLLRKICVNSIFSVFDECLKGLSAFDDSRWPGTNAYFFRMFYVAFNQHCSVLLKKTDVLNDLRAEKFDMIFSVHMCGSGLKELLNITTHVYVSSCPIMDHTSYIFGIPNPLSYLPAVSDISMSDKPSYMERVRNIIESLTMTYAHFESMSETTEVYRKQFGADFPAIDQIIRESPLSFIGVHPLVDFPRPIFHNTIFIGGLSMEDEKDTTLEEPFKSEMEKGRNGVILFSFGSIADTNHLPKEVRENLFTTFKQLSDYHFIIKVSNGDQLSAKLASDTSNVFAWEWLPQIQLLAHPRLRAFISHGGSNSVLEAARSGVPLVSMPFFGDHFRSAKVAERNGWGISFRKEKLIYGHKEFMATLRTIFDEPKYSDAAKRTKKLLESTPFNATDNLIKYTQFLGENNGQLPELQSEGRNLYTIIYYNLDIFVPFLSITFALCFLLLKVVIRLCTILVSLFKKSTMKQKEKLT
ncbi:UDP-glucoronosyl and UDP-glucosyl transferase domain-containing protein [Ditylenchus destructor]|nr:UDP-glucoronosyl and UDP-glucosyl transferase domain-containing protein [Ditylenchus destructor]